MDFSITATITTFFSTLFTRLFLDYYTLTIVALLMSIGAVANLQITTNKHSKKQIPVNPKVSLITSLIIIIGCLYYTFIFSAPTKIETFVNSENNISVTIKTLNYKIPFNTITKTVNNVDFAEITTEEKKIRNHIMPINKNSKKYNRYYQTIYNILLFSQEQVIPLTSYSFTKKEKETVDKIANMINKSIDTKKALTYTIHRTIAYIALACSILACLLSLFAFFRKEPDTTISNEDQEDLKQVDTVIRTNDMKKDVNSIRAFIINNYTLLPTILIQSFIALICCFILLYTIPMTVMNYAGKNSKANLKQQYSFVSPYVKSSKDLYLVGAYLQEQVIDNTQQYRVVLVDYYRKIAYLTEFSTEKEKLNKIVEDINYATEYRKNYFYSTEIPLYGHILSIAIYILFAIIVIIIAILLMFKFSKKENEMLRTKRLYEKVIKK